MSFVRNIFGVGKVGTADDKVTEPTNKEAATNDSVEQDDDDEETEEDTEDEDDGIETDNMVESISSDGPRPEPDCVALSSFFTYWYVHVLYVWGVRVVGTT